MATDIASDRLPLSLGWRYIAHKRELIPRRILRAYPKCLIYLIRATLDVVFGPTPLWPRGYAGVYPLSVFRVRLAAKNPNAQK